LPVEIVYTPLNIDDFIYLFFYGRASWQFWQNSYANFAANPFSSSSNGFYGTIGVRVAGFIFVEKKSYRASMSVFMEYTTKNELRLGMSADIIGSIFGMARAVSDAFGEQYKNDNPDKFFCGR
jgi:hypothetical protein